MQGFGFRVSGVVGFQGLGFQGLAFWVPSKGDLGFL